MFKIRQTVLRSFPEVVLVDRVAVLSITIVTGGAASGTIALGTEDKEGNFVAVESGMSIAMTPEQYEKWGKDDEYAQLCILENAGCDVL